MSKAKDREEFIALVIEEGGTLDTARLILRDAATVQRISGDQCNGDVPASAEKRCEAAERRIAERAAAFGARTKCGGDPRGYCVKLLLKSGRYNTWGGAEEGYGVPS